MDSNYSLADVAAVTRDGGGSMGGAWWLILLFLFLIGSNGFGFGAGSRGDFVTSADLNSAIAGQTSAINQQQILLSSANNNYETARLIDALGANLAAQNNTNLVNAIQGFNQLNLGLSAGFAGIQSSISQLSYQLDKCCCDIKTQMLQNRLDDANAVIVSQNGVISNANQSQYLLSMLGKYTPGSGTTTAA